MKKLNKVKFFGAILACTFLLSGCFNFGGEPDEPSVEIGDNKVYENSAFSISFPRDWEIIEPSDFTDDVPGETQVVFRNNIKNENFTANVNVIRKTLLEPTDTIEYAKMVMNRQSSGLYGYRETRKDDSTIMVGDSEQSTFFIGFEARVSPEERLVRYLQTFGIKDKFGYIITGSFAAEESSSVVNTVGEIVKSFRIK